MKKLTALILALVMLLSLGAVSAFASEEPKELHIVPTQVNPNLDVVVNTNDAAALIVCGSVFEQLVTVDENYEPIPELCTGWDINDDSTEYVYHLREGIKFHNGETMTAEDVVASMNRWIDSVDAVSGYVGGAHFEVVDDATVKITMPQPYAYLNNLIGAYANRPVITPASVIENIDETNVMTEFIGTGPYVLDEVKEDQYVKLTRFEDYQPYGEEGDFSGWGGYKHANIDTIWFDYISDDNTIINGMLTGQFQACSGIGYDSLEQFQDDPAFEVTMSASAMPMMIFNKKEGLAADAAFRRAINTALNADEILYGAFGSRDYYSLCSSYMFPSQPLWYSEAGSEFYNQGDGEKAVQLLEEAGYDFQEPFKILVASDSTDFYNMAVVIQGQLQAAGIPCELLTYDWATFVSIRNDEPSQYNAFITNFSPKTVPSMNLYLTPDWAGWCEDQRVQDDLAAINASTSLEDGAAIWNDLQEYLWSDYMPVANFGVQNVSMISSSSVEGLGYMERVVYVDADFVE